MIGPWACTSGPSGGAEALACASRLNLFSWFGFVRHSFRQFIYIAPQRLPFGAFVLVQTVERLRIAHGGEVGITLPVRQPSADFLLQLGVVLLGIAGIDRQVIAQPSERSAVEHAHDFVG